jgi:ribosomal protein S18 acetylase RimI-like enzyme
VVHGLTRRLSDRIVAELPETVRLRPAQADDRDLLLATYASTRADELATIPWSDAEKAAFVAMQFDAQDRSYHEAYPEGEFLVVTHDHVPAGRLYLVSLESEVRVVDIGLLPAHRGMGIGSALLRSVIFTADEAGLAVSLHVESWNPAKHLYERLGFRSVEARGIHEFMRRPAGGQLKTAS